MADGRYIGKYRFDYNSAVNY